MNKLSNSEKLTIWNSIRTSINTWVGLLATLLTSCTALFFAALGVIFANSDKLKDLTIVIFTFGLFLGVLGFCVVIWHTANALKWAVRSARKIENDLFEEDAYKITTVVNNHLLWGIGRPIEDYSKIWINGLTIAAGVICLWRFFVLLNII